MVAWPPRPMVAEAPLPPMEIIEPSPSTVTQALLVASEALPPRLKVGWSSRPPASMNTRPLAGTFSVAPPPRPIDRPPPKPLSGSPGAAVVLPGDVPGRAGAGHGDRARRHSFRGDPGVRPWARCRQDRAAVDLERARARVAEVAADANVRHGRIALPKRPRPGGIAGRDDSGACLAGGQRQRHGGARGERRPVTNPSHASMPP